MSCWTRSSARARPAPWRAGYVKVARERIDSTLELDESAMRTMASKRSQPKVPFGALVETGMIAPGALLTDAKGRWQARVCADASVEHGGEQGSIHKIGAAAQGAPSCNGWTFWHIEFEGALAPLDTLRQRYLLTLD
jgi:modification methylase